MKLSLALLAAPALAFAPAGSQRTPVHMEAVRSDVAAAALGAAALFAPVAAFAGDVRRGVENEDLARAGRRRGGRERRKNAPARPAAPPRRRRGPPGRERGPSGESDVA